MTYKNFMILRERVVFSLLVLVAILFPPACSPRPQSHPLNTAAVPTNARFLEQCSTLGSMMCGAVSALSGETAVEGRSACIAYIESSGRRIEQCGSFPASQPYTASPPASTASPPASRPQPTKTGHLSTKTAHLSWKDNSGDENGFRIYRITGNEKIKIAELGPDVTHYIDKDAPPKACYIVTAFNSDGESSPTSKICLPE
jgi:hypothetical protein